MRWIGFDFDCTLVSIWEIMLEDRPKPRVSVGDLRHSERGVGIVIGHPDDPEVANRPAAADFVLESTVEAERLLNTLAR